MQIILDTSFIISCIKEKIDFTQAEEHGKLLLPEQVVGELKKISEKSRGKDSERAELALKIIDKNKNKFKKIKLERKHVDAGIKKFVEENKDARIGVATLDKELKRELKGKATVLSVRSKKKIVMI